MLEKTGYPNSGAANIVIQVDGSGQGLNRILWVHLCETFYMSDGLAHGVPIDIAGCELACAQEVVGGVSRKGLTNIESVDATNDLQCSLFE